MAAARSLLGRGPAGGARERGNRAALLHAWHVDVVASVAGTGPDGRDTQGGQGMAETTDDVRRDIELTRERMSSTFAELERSEERRVGKECRSRWGRDS